MITGGMFNAIPSDARFGMAFMILLAIPLAGITRKDLQQSEELATPCSFGKT